MINKASLHKILDVVESGDRLLGGEIKILREAVDLLDDLAMTLDQIMKGSANAIMRGQARFDASDTGAFRAVNDDDQTGRP